MPTTDWKSGSSCEHLKKLFERWAALHQDYTEALQRAGVSDAHGWWTNERANIGFIAAATWKLGGVALEEYPARRAEGELDREIRGEFFPRVDLYAQVNLENQLRYIVIESKMYLYQETIGFDTLINRINGRLDEATEQFERLHPAEKEGCECYAICFVMLKFSTPVAIIDIRRKIGDIFTKLSEGDTDVCFFKSYLIDEPVNYNGYIFPGIIAFGRKIKA